MSSVFFFPIFLENDLLKVDKILGLTFLRKKRLRRIQNGVFPFTVSKFCDRWIVYNSRFIRVEEAVSRSQRLLRRKIWPKNRSLSMTKLKANVCRNSTFQVNRIKNAT